MNTPKLNVTLREKAGVALEKSRETGLVPAILYGNKIKPAMYWVKYLEFEKLYKSAGESTILELAVEGDKEKNVNVLVQDITRDPLSSRFTHVDFYQVRMDKEIETDIPLEFVGESPAVKELSGILVRSLNEVKVKCLPKDLPHAIEINVSLLKTFADVISVKNIVLPKGVTMLETADTTIATVTPPRSEAEMAALDEKVEMDVTQVEGMVKEEPVAEGEIAGIAPEGETDKKDKKEEKKEDPSRRAHAEAEKKEEKK